MLGRIADSIAVLFLKKNIINEDELPVYQYGMQVLICNIAGMLTVLIVGILISRLVESIIFYYNLCYIKNIYRRVSCKNSISM